MKSRPSFKSTMTMAGLMLLSMLWPVTMAFAADPVLLDQGANWTSTTRNDFYGRDQGSQIMPLRWISALKQTNGQPFMVDSLSRYGYLPNETSDPPGLPVGFTVASGGAAGAMIGMSCAACHTRQIEVAGTAYRVDGGPGIVDFQSFLSDLDTTVKNVLDNAAAFNAFASSVLGPNPTPAKSSALRTALSAWHLPYHTLMQRALPDPAWGPARLDAVTMIFNRLTGLDIGPPPTYLIANNIQRADAPVRYPFLWNAPIQDKTQWPGFADNGSSVLGLARNLGEVIGVFASFKPKKDNWSLLGVDYLNANSANFSGLNALEELIRKIGSPKWPWPVDGALATQGKAVFERSVADGGCLSCHGVTPGPTRFPNDSTWSTPIQDVGTDSREYDVIQRRVSTGVLQGAKIPFLTTSLQSTDTALNVLTTSVLGSILQHYSPLHLDMEMNARATASRALGSIETAPSSLHPSQLSELKGSFRAPAKAANVPPGSGALRAPNAVATTESAVPVSAGYAYESRVLQGIWAVAPYLHNGSVPSLVELLKPAAERVSEFKIGPNYDIENVGLAANQSKFNYVLKTTDCSNRNSGHSRCGHEFGTSLSASEKRALLEYLKTL